MTLTSNTPITQENAALLKAGDWLRHERGPIGRLARVTSSHIYISRDGLPDIGDRHPGFTYIGPDLGGGWIGWAGGENPVPGMDVTVRFRDGDESDLLNSASFDWSWPCVVGVPEVDVVAFRPALAKPAEDHIGDATEKVDWSVVGPKLVEEVREALADVAYAPGDHPIVPIKHDAFVKRIASALAAAQPEGK